MSLWDVFCYKQKTEYEMRISDWSSDVCSSDLTTAAEVFKLKPDGVLLSNGPGDPEPCSYAIRATREFLAKKMPLFGICLVHQILGLSLNVKTLKLKLGPHGPNHPFQFLVSFLFLITLQYHVLTFFLYFFFFSFLFIFFFFLFF